MIPESLPWPILNTNEHQTNLRNKRSLSRRGRRNSAPPKPIYIEGKKSKITQNLGTANAICWNSIGVFNDYGLNHIFFRDKTFLFFKIES